VNGDEHRTLREQLGAYALGQLDADARVAVRAHLDGCPACRAELAEIAPLADLLRRVDPDGSPTRPRRQRTWASRSYAEFVRRTRIGTPDSASRRHGGARGLWRLLRRWWRASSASVSVRCWTAVTSRATYRWSRSW
jgi:anti-sigma factor RsiW